MWTMYKLVHCHQEHTGGGDGDDKADDVVLERKHKCAEEQKPKKALKAHFSKRTLDAFEESIYYSARKTK